MRSWVVLEQYQSVHCRRGIVLSEKPGRLRLVATAFLWSTAAVLYPMHADRFECMMSKSRAHGYGL